MSRALPAYAAERVIRASEIRLYCQTSWRTDGGRPPNLLLQEFEDFFEELLAVLFEKNKMRGVLDQNIALHRSVYELTHQTFAVLLKRPSIVIAADHQGGHVYIGSAPQGPARRL